MHRWPGIASCAVATSCLALAVGCASVDVTKTVDVRLAETDADQVAILSELPKDRRYMEIATVSSKGWDTDEADEMHEELRERCAELGANAVVLLHSGIDDDGELWSTGAAIWYTGPR